VTPHRRLIPLRWLVMVGSLCVALAMFWSTVSGVAPSRGAREQAGDELVLQAESLLDVALGLAEVRDSSPAPDLTVLFAVKPPPLPEPDRPVAVRTPSAPPLVFSVDMIIAAGEQGRAILSGRLTRVGDVLRDGSRVVDIQSDGVTLETRGRLRRLPAPSGRVASP
jgi:hypothetical protein